MIASVGRIVWQLLFRGRKATRRAVAAFASGLRDARVLEVGSGPRIDGDYPYSSADLFHHSCTVVRSDIDPTFGHELVDCTTMEFDGEWDAIVATSVLEHIYEVEEAITRIHKALMPGGRLLVTVPFAFPLHNEPIDFWRFTEHSLRQLFGEFSQVEVTWRGLRRAPLQYQIVAVR